MFEIEALWLERELGALKGDGVSPVLNLGSSTLEFRTVHQPFIQKQLFGPLEEAGIKVIHIDQKQNTGVDVSLDMSKPESREKVRALGGRAVICSNLFEHVPDTGFLAETLMEILPEGGFLAVTVPYSYPYHPDPIDTLFRPSPEEICAMFPGFRPVRQEILDCGSLWQSIRRKPGKLIRMVLRSLLPFIRFEGWKSVMHHWCWLFKRYQVSCIVLRKESV